MMKWMVWNIERKRNERKTKMEMAQFDFRKINFYYDYHSKCCIWLDLDCVWAYTCKCLCILFTDLTCGHNKRNVWNVFTQHTSHSASKSNEQFIQADEDNVIPTMRYFFSCLVCTFWILVLFFASFVRLLWRNVFLVNTQHKYQALNNEKIRKKLRWENISFDNSFLTLYSVYDYSKFSLHFNIYYYNIILICCWSQKNQNLKNHTIQTIFS